MYLGTYTLRDSNQMATQLLSFSKGIPVFCFRGEMGAGKTTLIGKICRALGVQEVVSSPTYSLINEYAGVGGQVLYHMDFYRLEDPKEAATLGLGDYFHSGNYCFVEWPERISDYLPDSYILVDLKPSSRADAKLESRDVFAKVISL